MKTSNQRIDISSTPDITDRIRSLFPILGQKINNYPLVYFDNAATTQKPQVVIDTITNYYSHNNANIHRGIHTLAERATMAFEDTRSKVSRLLNSREREEIIFTYGTTDSINLVAMSYAQSFLKPGDEIIISGMEHHSNIVPWQIACEKTGARLKVIPINDKGELLIDRYISLFTGKTKLVSIVHVSNALGTINPINEIIKIAHQNGAIVMVDGAQSVAHMKIDVQDLDCDLFAFSSHKIFGPTGVGVLYGKRELLEKMHPYRAGGEMISEVTFDKTTYNDLPFKFEAGTPNIADVIGLNAALEFYTSLPLADTRAHEKRLLEYATGTLKTIKGLRIIGEAENKTGIISFIIDGMHHFDLGTLLDTMGIAVRTGHHCTQPLMARFGVEGTTRASFSIYNTFEEVDRLAEALFKITRK